MMIAGFSELKYDEIPAKLNLEILQMRIRYYGFQKNK